MWDINVVAAECMSELDKLGIPYKKVNRFLVDNRAFYRWGYCKNNGDGFVIGINADLLDEQNNITSLKDTLIHELLHTCDGCEGHGELWKKYAAKVNSAYGYNIKRLTSAEEKGLNYRRPHKEKTYKYELKCRCCGNVYHRKIACDFVRFPNFYICGGCGKNAIVRLK